MNDDASRVKSLYIDVTGSPRQDPVRLPKAILGSKPGALPNTQVRLIWKEFKEIYGLWSVFLLFMLLPREFYHTLRRRYFFYFQTCIVTRRKVAHGFDTPTYSIPMTLLFCDEAWTIYT